LTIGRGNIKIIPDILISGAEGSGNGINGLIGMELLKMVQDKKVEKQVLTETKK
jgi:hypothetical protein